MENWKTVSRKTILDYSKFMTIEEHHIQLPDGLEITDWPIVVTPDYINVVAVTDDDKFLIFRQTKYAVAGTTLAIVGGYIEPGEEPLVAAKRELMEETGYAGGQWRFLGEYVVDANRGCGTAYFFLAEGVAKVAEADADDLEEQELLLFTRSEVEQAIANNAFKALPYAATVALALLLLGS